ncbi:LSM12 homolog A [Chironomus tepperi]|uniref:LSM12 homolog A n=1 Tax=Chironomus tepperi TaxID=113505 RepID=UPI00391F8EB2
MDCFSIGSIVVVKTMHDDLIEGQVMAFDLNTKLLILKNVSENSNRLNNVFIINLPHCKDVTVKKELVGSENSEPQSINLQRLSNRVRNQVEQKKRLVSALKANASEEAQNLYIFLAKMLTEQVYWNGIDIVVFDDVVIRPPYRVENVEAKSSGKQRELEYIKKLVMNRQNQINSLASSKAPETSSTKN